MDAEPESDARAPSSAPTSAPLSDAEPAVSTPMSVADPPRPEPARPTRPSRDRRVVAGIVAALVAVAVAAWVIVRALAGAPRVAFGVAALSSDEAILFTRRGDGAAARVNAVELVRATGGLRWTHDVSPLEPFEVSGYSAVAASDDRVVLSGARDGGTVVEALVRTSGDFAWATVVARDASTPRAGPMLLVDAPRVYAIHAKAGGGAAITALELDAGHALWTLDLASPDAPVVLLAAERLLVGGSDGVALVDGVTGGVKRAVPMRQIACETPLGVVGFDGAHHVTLFAPPGPTGESGASVTELDRNASRGPCGVRGEDVVFSVVRDGRRGLMRLEPTTGRQRWIVDLGSVELGAFETVDGRLPRFLPVALTRRADDATHVAVVDVDEGVVVRDPPIDARASAFVSAERAWIRAGSVIVALDPATGNIERATSYPSLFREGVVRRDDARFGVLFAVGDDSRRPPDLPWIAIDLATALTRRTNGGVASTDVTARGWP
ncbi:MAG: PQQ-binding-like beta-propeller repeat protein [Polyangiaceae bacterium]